MASNMISLRRMAATSWRAFTSRNAPITSRIVCRIYQNPLHCNTRSVTPHLRACNFSSTTPVASTKPTTPQPTQTPKPPPYTPQDLTLLSEIEKRLIWLSTYTIHHANHIRPNPSGVKIGGHQASSTSLSTLITALYFRLLKPWDRVAVKPHASPIFHAAHYLHGTQTVERLKG
ncbi:hypothetical protein HK102_011780, partial [Quaeritorhiza haematococci]